MTKLEGMAIWTQQVGRASSMPRNVNYLGEERVIALQLVDGVTDGCQQIMDEL